MTPATRPNTDTEPTPRDVDLAVRSVLAGPLAPLNGTPEGRADGHVFPGRLLGLRHAEALPEGTRLVRVAPGTVVTPLARDHLKRLGIDVRFAARAEVERLGNAGEWGFAVESRSGLVEALRRSFLDGSDGWVEVGQTLGEAAAWVAGARGPSRGALVLTEEASVAVYRACQVAGVRAASAEEVEGVARAVRALGLNLLVVEPAGKPLGLIRQLGAAFRRGGGPRVPFWLGQGPEMAVRR